MIQYKIWTQKYGEPFKTKLNHLLSQSKLSKDNWDEENLSNIYCFKCTPSKKEKEQALNNIVSLIGDFIQEEVLTEFAKSYLKTRKDLDRSKKREIEKLFIHNNYITKEEGVSYIAYYVIYTPILKELEKYKQINIDGWITFRTQKYKIILEDVIEQTIYDYEMQKDYIQFINFLLQVKAMQEEQVELVHLIPQFNGDILLYDQDEKEQTKDWMEVLCEEIEDEKLTTEDKVFHILISLAPKKIILHDHYNKLNEQFLQTLKNLFFNQIDYCAGCKICQKGL